MKFPMISFCNSKPMMTRFAYDYAIQEFTLMYEENYGMQVPENVVAFLYGNNTIDELANTSHDPDVSVLAQIMSNNFSDPSFDQTIQQSFGLTLDEFFVYLMNSFSITSPDYLIWFYDPTYCNCFKLNSGETQNGSKVDPLEQESTGYGNSIWSVNFIDVFTNQTGNFLNYYNTYSVGLKISIDEQNTIPLYAFNMMTSKPGS